MAPSDHQEHGVTTGGRQKRVESDQKQGSGQVAATYHLVSMRLDFDGAFGRLFMLSAGARTGRKITHRHPLDPERS